jgi:hypothetical protein
VSDQQPPQQPSDPQPPFGAPPPYAPPPQAPGYGQEPQQWHQQGYGYGMTAEPKTLGLATAALVCGIVGLLLFNIILGPLAFIFGLQARRRIQESNGTLKGMGMATTGIIMGPIDVVVWLLILGIAV